MIGKGSQSGVRYRICNLPVSANTFLRKLPSIPEDKGEYKRGVEARPFASDKIFDNVQIALTTSFFFRGKWSLLLFHGQSSHKQAKIIDRLHVSSNISKTYQEIASCCTSVERAIKYDHFRI